MPATGSPNTRTRSAACTSTISGSIRRPATGRTQLVYIIGPYGARRNLPPDELQANVDAAMRAAAHLVRLGYIPVVPHAYHYVVATGEACPDEDGWLEVCLGLLSRCDLALTLEGWRDSAGSRIEVAGCRETGTPVYSRLADLPLPDDERRRRILRNHPAAAPCHQCPDVLECICQDLRVLDMGRYECRRGK